MTRRAHPPDLSSVNSACDVRRFEVRIVVDKENRDVAARFLYDLPPL